MMIHMADVHRNSVSWGPRKIRVAGARKAGSPAADESRRMRIDVDHSLLCDVRAAWAQICPSDPGATGRCFERVD
eukprot:3595992-Pyramimonas_sp.AAC.1